jgi:5-methylcytosine-specific restriction endonuclease McrA
MRDIAHKAIVLKLNSGWNPVGVELVGKTICDLMTGVVDALDIVYAVNDDGSLKSDEYEYINPVSWDEWKKLPVRPWDLSIHSTFMHIRVPTVVITKNYAKVPDKKFKGKPTKEGLFIRDNGMDAYTGKELAFEDATIDHVVPRFRGGTDTYDNTVLTTKKINNDKGSKLNPEAGLTLLVNPHHPKPVKVSHTIRKARHQDWKHFLVAGK